MRKHSELGTRNCHQKSFRKVWTIYIENVDQKMNFLYGSDEIEIRLSFYRSLSTFWNIYGGLCTQVFFFISMRVRNGSKSFVSKNQKSYNHKPNIKPEIFSNSIV